MMRLSGCEWDAGRAGTLSPAGLSFSVFLIDGGLNLFPNAFRRILYREELAGSLGDGFQVSQQGTAQITTLNVRMHGQILARADQFRHVCLKLLTFHFLGVFHQRTSPG